VEVKTRTGDSYEAAVGAVDFYKQKKLRSAILFYLRSNPEYANYFIQVDVCVVLVEQIDISRNSVIIIENVMEF
jgi:Holliday junction resolvase-like predicted endonuclease